MAIDFPAAPANGATHTAAGVVWLFDGTKWKANSATIPGDITGVAAGTGLTGGGTSGDVSLALQVPVSVANGGTGSSTAAAAPFVEIAGDTMTGGLTIAPASGTPAITLTRPTGGDEAYIWGMRGATARWRLNLGNAVAESGSNAGSDFSIQRYNDAGAVIDSPLTIFRSSGAATFSGAVTAGGNVTIPVNARFDHGGNFQIYYNSSACYLWWYTPNNTFLKYNQATGDLEQYVNNTRNFNSRNSDGVFVNDRAAVAGNGAYINTASFAKYKSKVRTIENPAERLKKLKPVSYTFDPTGQEHTGFIIEDLVEDYPETIKRHPETGEVEGYSAEMIIAGLTAALQDALRRIEALEGK